MGTLVVLTLVVDDFTRQCSIQQTTGQRKHDPLEVIHTQRSLEHDQFIRQHVLFEIGARLECRSKCEDFVGEFTLAKLADVSGSRADEHDAVHNFESFSRDPAIGLTRRSGIIGQGSEDHGLAGSAGGFEKGETVRNGPNRRLMIQNEGGTSRNKVHRISRKVGLGCRDRFGASRKSSPQATPQVMAARTAVVQNSPTNLVWIC